MKNVKQIATYVKVICLELYMATKNPNSKQWCDLFDTAWSL